MSSLDNAPMIPSSLAMLLDGMPHESLLTRGRRARIERLEEALGKATKIADQIKIVIAELDEAMASNLFEIDSVLDERASLTDLLNEATSTVTRIEAERLEHLAAL